MKLFKLLYVLLITFSVDSILINTYINAQSIYNYTESVESLTGQTRTFEDSIYKNQLSILKDDARIRVDMAVSAMQLEEFHDAYNYIDDAMGITMMTLAK